MATESVQLPSRAETCAFVGKNARGHWVVRDGAGAYGGVFVNRTEALRFAHEEGLAHLPRRERIIFLDKLSL